MKTSILLYFSLNKIHEFISTSSTDYQVYLHILTVGFTIKRTIIESVPSHVLVRLVQGSLAFLSWQGVTWVSLSFKFTQLRHNSRMVRVLWGFSLRQGENSQTQRPLVAMDFKKKVNLPCFLELHRENHWKTYAALLVHKADLSQAIVGVAAEVSHMSTEHVFELSSEIETVVNRDREDVRNFVWIFSKNARRKNNPCFHVFLGNYKSIPWREIIENSSELGLPTCTLIRGHRRCFLFCVATTQDHNTIH